MYRAASIVLDLLFSEHFGKISCTLLYIVISCVCYLHSIAFFVWAITHSHCCRSEVKLHSIKPHHNIDWVRSSVWSGLNVWTHNIRVSKQIVMYISAIRRRKVTIPCCKRVVVLLFLTEFKVGISGELFGAIDGIQTEGSSLIVYVFHYKTIIHQ